MDEAASIKAGLGRAVCSNCGHFHRPILAKKCACCAVDLSKVESDGGIAL